MMATDDMAIDAIYRDGVLKPLHSVDLPENTLVKVEIKLRSETATGSLAKYKGILAGKDNFSLEEIEEAVQSVMDSRLGKTVANLDQDGK
jgi:predicted DNA-binding antitoxin AbrB/MazE fold protein